MGRVFALGFGGYNEHSENSDAQGQCTAVIPHFGENGSLPPSVHCASLDEIEERFGSSTEICRAEMQSLCWVVR